VADFIQPKMHLTKELIQDPAYHPFIDDKVLADINEMLAEETEVLIPKQDQVFRAFNLCPLADVKVVIVGQDCYHSLRRGKRVADGLCFSSGIQEYCPPSLTRIKKHFKSSLGDTNSLESWAKQGVLLINSALTVCQSQPGCHLALWERITDAIIQGISREREKVVFMLWGKYAQKKAKLIDTEKHLVLTGVHPSPFTNNSWFENPDFGVLANEYLRQHYEVQIEW